MKQVYTLIIAALLLLSACNKQPSTSFNTGRVIVINEGGFQHGNASVSVYDPTAKTVTNNVFMNENGFSMGDVAQSLYLMGDTAFIVMNNSQKVVVADAKNNFKYLYSINIPGSSLRFFIPVGGSKAYVTELYANKIWVVDYRTGTLLKSIPVNGWTEHLINSGGKIYVEEATTPGGAAVHAILQIDPATDQITNSIALSSDPASMILSQSNQLFVLSPQQTSPISNASIYRIDLPSFSISKKIDFSPSRTPNFIRYSALSDQILFSDSGGIYNMLTTDTITPASTFIKSNSWNVYGLNADPATGDIYISDAVDYQQASHIMRYSKNGVLLDHFTAGIITNGFVFE